jgi:hypothetical protein
MDPDLGLRSCIRTLSIPNPAPFHGKALEKPHHNIVDDS